METSTTGRPNSSLLFCSLSARWFHRSIKPTDGSIRSCEGMCAGSHRVRFPPLSFCALECSESHAVQPKDQ